VVAVLLLINMRFEWWNAALLFTLWLAQFLVADWRSEVSVAYGAWAAGLLISWLWVPPEAPRTFLRLLRSQARKGGRISP
jgi:hypothetical protein